MITRTLIFSAALSLSLVSVAIGGDAYSEINWHYLLVLPLGIAVALVIKFVWDIRALLGYPWPSSKKRKLK